MVAVETEQRFLDGGMKRIDDNVRKLAAKAVSKGKLTQEQADANVAGRSAASRRRSTAARSRAATSSSRR